MGAPGILFFKSLLEFWDPLCFVLKLDGKICLHNSSVFQKINHPHTTSINVFYLRESGGIVL